MISALNRKLLRDLKLLRAQTFTTAVLVIAGVSLLVSAWSAYHSLKAARDSYYASHAFADVFAEVKSAPRSLIDKISAIEGIELSNARIVEEGLIDLADQAEPAVGRFVTAPEATPRSLNRIHLRQGRLPSIGIEAEAVVHEGFAKVHHLKPGDRVRVTLRGRQEKILIVGIGLSPEFVYALSSSSPLPDDQHFGVFWLEGRALERITDRAGAFNSLVIRLKEKTSEAHVRDQLDRILAPYGTGGSYGRDRQTSSMFLDDEIRQQRVTAFFFPAVFLGVAAFLIHVVSSRLIALQRPQIATLKALGYSNREVSRHYVLLITVMMLIGAVPGIALGAWIGRLEAMAYEDFFRFPQLDFSLSPSASVVGLIAGVIPGLIGAYGSIRVAFALQPAEAMRPPSPPIFHATLLERLGLQKYWSVPGRLILRNLFFRPIRLAVSVFGITLALAIVISSGFWSDTVHYMVDTQFQRLQREDLSVTMIAPVKAEGLNELRRIDGVIAVEGYREVPVRIRHQNLSKETVLFGWPPGAEMRQKLDIGLAKISLPQEGLLLSRFFHDRWGLRSGDLLQVQVLEGAQKTVTVSIAGFTDDLLGTSASMRIENLWRILNEEPVYNLATLRIDPTKSETIYVRLKAAANILGVQMKTSLYRGFEESMGRIIRISTAILLTFALAITLGIIYNSMRVSFSERAWELASMRVLGFSRNDVFFFLVTEVSTQVLLAIIPGCLLGRGLAILSLSLVNTETFGFPAVIYSSTYAQGILVALIALALGAVVVYRMIKKINLADALKSRE